MRIGKYNLKSTLIENYRKSLKNSVKNLHEDEDYDTGDPTQLNDLPILPRITHGSKTRGTPFQYSNNLGISGYTQTQIDTLDRSIFNAFGIHLSQMSREMIIALLSINNNQTLTPAQLAAILNMPGNTPMENVAAMSTQLLIVMAVIAAACAGVPVLTAAGMTQTAALLAGTIQVVDFLDNIDDYFLTPMNNLESILAFLAHLGEESGSDREEINRIIRTIQEYYRDIMNTHIRYSGQELRDMMNDVERGLTPPSSGEHLLYLSDPRQQFIPGHNGTMPHNIYIYRWDASQGIWILARVVSQSDDDWWEILFNENGNTPVYDGRQSKGWLPGSITISNPNPVPVGTPSLQVPGFERDPIPFGVDPAKHHTSPTFVGPPPPQQ